MQRIERPTTTEQACYVCNFMVPGFSLNNTARSAEFQPENYSPAKSDTEQEGVSSREEVDECDKKSLESLTDTLENILAEYGLQATMYLPSKSARVSTPREALIKSKRDDPKIDCEVVVDSKLKKFRFTVFDVENIEKGRGKARIIPEDVLDSSCLHLLIQGKGELNLVLGSENLRDDFVVSFRELIRRRGGSLPA